MRRQRRKREMGNALLEVNSWFSCDREQIEISRSLYLICERLFVSSLKLRDAVMREGSNLKGGH